MFPVVMVIRLPALAGGSRLSFFVVGVGQIVAVGPTVYSDQKWQVGDRVAGAIHAASGFR